MSDLDESVQDERNASYSSTDESLVDVVERNSDEQLPTDRIIDLSIECNTKVDQEEDEKATSMTCTNTVDSYSDISENTGGPRATSRNPCSTSVAWKLCMQERYSECLRLLDEEGLLHCPRAGQEMQVDVLCLQGICHFEGHGHRAHALACFAGALARDPMHMRSLMYYAVLQKEAKKFDVAVEMIEKAYSAVCMTNATTDGCFRPSKEDVCHAYANILTDAATQDKLQGKDGWEEKYRKSIEVCPRHAPAHYNLGVAAAEADDMDKALEWYQRAVEIHPAYVEALCNMGVAQQQLGRLEDAIKSYQKAYNLAPTVDMVAKNLAIALNLYGTEVKDSRGDLQEAIRLYEKAVSVLPTCVEALYNLGVAYAEAGDLDKAIFAYRCTIRENGTCAEAHNNLGVLYRMKGQMQLALKSYEAALEAQPDFPQGLNNVAVMYTQQGKASMAFNVLQAAIMADQTYAEAWNNLGVLQRDVGEAQAALESYRKCCALEPHNRNAGQNLLLGLNYLYDGNEREICKAHMEWGVKFRGLHPMLPACDKEERRKHEKIRLGYVSPDFFIHSVSFFAEAPIENFNRRLFEVTIYSVCANPDEKTARLQGEVESYGGIWKDVSSLSEVQLSDLIRSDEIDILIDLTGHTANNRLGTFAMKPAPVQVTWIGYPNTTGLDTIDYRITDSLCDPLDTNQKFTEKLVRLDNFFLCYTPCPEVPGVAPLPADTNGYITFGSFNALAKQTPDVLRTWSNILCSVPNSRLIMKNKPFACESVKQKYWHMFEEFGISRDRIDLLPLAPTTERHLDQYSMIDICLDPFPYAGTTTTAEALYMGVPCLTMRGKGHAHNVGVSMITNVGLGNEWIAESKQDYVHKAKESASNIQALRHLRSSLRSLMSSSPVCNVSLFMDNLERKLSAMWDDYLVSPSI